VERKYIDVNIFVYWLAGEGKLHEKSKKWIKEIERSTRGEFFTSTISIYETAVIIAGLTGRTLKDKEFVEDIYNAFTELNKLRLQPLDRKILKKAINAVKEKNLDLEDAIHYATAKEGNATRIITNDSDFDKTDILRVF